MNVVLDTNVIISGLLWQKTTGAIFDLADESKIKIVLTPKIILEIVRVLKYPRIKKQLDRMNLSISEIMGYLLQVGEIYPDIRVDVNISDPTDKIFLGAALISEAEFLVSGDPHLLDLKEFKRTKIINPRSFLEKF